MDKKFTIIIPFLNEGHKVRHTVKSIKETQTFDNEIILINDASTDNYDYMSVATEYECKFIENPGRLGVAESRSKGVSLAKNDYIILFDAHMTLPDYDWDQRIYDIISKDHRAIYCTHIGVLNNEGKKYPNGDDRAQGAHYFWEKGEKDYLEPKWSTFKDTENLTTNIPCVLGATYCFHKDYFNKIRGLVGLKEYGSDEAFMSIKTWLEGGHVKLINNVKIGHWFKDTYGHGYPVTWQCTIYNKLFIIYTCAKNKDKHLKLLSNKGDMKLTCQDLWNQNKSYMDAFRNYFQNELFNYDFEFLEEFNKKYLDNGFTISDSEVKEIREKYKV